MGDRLCELRWRVDFWRRKNPFSKQEQSKTKEAKQVSRFHSAVGSRGETVTPPEFARGRVGAS